MTYHLTIFNTILFAKGSFSGTKCTKIVFFFCRGIARNQATGLPVQSSPRPLSRLGTGISPPQSTNSASGCPVRFFINNNNVLQGLKNNNRPNNKQICITPYGRNFRGAGARQCATEKREERKPGRRGTSLA